MKKKKPGDSMQNYATLTDVAKLANVSPVTVSRVYNPKWRGKITQATVEKVLDAANQLQYQPNGIARSLVSRKTGIIAVVMGVDTGYFYTEVLRKLVHKIQSTGRQALVFVADPSLGIENVVAQVHHYRVDAIVITAAATATNIVNYFTNTSIPVVLFNRSVENSNVSGVWSDGKRAVQKVVDFLIRNDHRSIGYISGDANPASEPDRSAGFYERINWYNLEPTHVYHGNFTYESGYQGAIEMLKSNNPPGAIFCGDDTMAMGAIDAARLELGLNVPRDVSIMGFDNHSVASLPCYDLTTIKHPLESMIDNLVEVIDDLATAPGLQVLKKFDMELVIRSTVRVLK